jgi:hypothetical protein
MKNNSNKDDDVSYIMAMELIKGFKLKTWNDCNFKSMIKSMLFLNLITTFIPGTLGVLILIQTKVSFEINNVIASLSAIILITFAFSIIVKTLKALNKIRIILKGRETE